MINKETNPFFSIIIPSHNGAFRIAHALDSCYQQSFRDFEVIVVCDACTDNTHEIAESFGATVIDVSFHRDGLSRNTGLDVARGDFILFLDDDDWWLHEFVLEQMHRMLNGSDADVLNYAIIWRTVGYKSEPAGRYLQMCAGHCWHRNFIADTRFDDAPFSSDTRFLDSLVKKHPVGLWTALPMYYYNYLRIDSLSDRHKKGEI